MIPVNNLFYFYFEEVNNLDFRYYYYYFEGLQSICVRVWKY